MQKYKTFGPRFWALLLDGILLLPLSILIDWLDGFEMSGALKTSIIVAVNLANVFYFVIMHARFGQTVGKMLMKVRVVDVSESPLKFRQAFVREIPQLFFVIASFIPFLMTNIIAAADPPITLISIFVLIWGVADIAVFFSNPKRRALHDLIAGSVVINLDPKAIN
jgi:uncharacterized RDD family membrane protein YckC